MALYAHRNPPWSSIHIKHCLVFAMKRRRHDDAHLRLGLDYFLGRREKRKEEEKEKRKRGGEKMEREEKKKGREEGEGSF